MLRRIPYFGYYLLKTPWNDFFRYTDYVKKQRNISRFQVYLEVISTVFRCNTSIMDYFTLRLYNLSLKERCAYIGMGFMYEYQLKMNPRQSRDILENKIKFLSVFKDYVGRDWATLDALKQDHTIAERFLKNPEGKAVIKYSKGNSGKWVHVLDTQGLTAEQLIERMQQKRADLIETFVVQHNDLMRIAPKGLNTVRLITQYHNGGALIIGACLRLSVDGFVDNLNAGNIGLPLDIKTGAVTDLGRYLDITKEDLEKHPLTGESLVGFTLPYWDRCIELVIRAAQLIPENRSVGWDVAVTNNGPVLIEGNHDWSYGLWELTNRKGFKNILQKYLNEE